MDEQNPVVIDWDIPNIARTANSPLHQIDPLKVRLSFVSAKDKKTKLLIKFTGFKINPFSCEYKVVTKHKESDKCFSFEGQCMISVAKSTIELSLDKTSDELLCFLCCERISVQCTVSIKEKRQTERVQSAKPIRRPKAEIQKEPTGYAGLLNQGATCYMNSYLQLLFHIPAFRRIVYSMPTTGTEDVNKSIPLNLQNLFYNLQFSKSPVSTIQLTTSFGWDAVETYTQNDVHEFSRIILDNLERKMKSSEDLKDSIANLFRGKSKTYVKCSKVNYSSYNLEYFYDLSLDVNGCKTIDDSLTNYIMPEKLEGKNQYNTGTTNGKQDAIMGIEFIEFPPILCLHLKRFQIDFEHMRQIKVNDRLEFPSELNLAKYIPSQSESSSLYELTGVLVHSGSVAGGHYYAFLRTSIERKWYRFDDSSVYFATEKEAIEDNFGSSGHSSSGFSAYYLIYTRKEDLPSLFQPVLDIEVPEHIRETAKLLFEENQKNAQKKSEQTKQIQIKFFTEDDMYKQCTAGTFGFSCDVKEPMTMPKSTNFAELYQIAAETFHLDIDEIRLWRCGTFSIPLVPIPCNNSLDIMSMCTAHVSDMTVFIQTKPKEEENILKNNQHVVYCKFFFAKQQSIQYIKSLLVDDDQTLLDIGKQINKAIGYPIETELLAFQELSTHHAMPLDTSTTVVMNMIDSGSLLIFQLPPNSPQIETSFSINQMKLPIIPNKTAFDLLPSLRTGLVSSFIEEYFQQMSCAIYSYDSPGDKLCSLIFPLSISYPELKLAISYASGIEFHPETTGMLLFPIDTISFAGPSPHPLDMNGRPRTVFGSSTKTLYVKYVKDIPDADLKQMYIYSVAFSRDAIHIDFNDLVLSKKGSSPKDLIEKMREMKVEIPTGVFRAYEMATGVFGQSLKIEESMKYGYLPIRIELIPEEQLINDGRKLIPVMTCYKDAWETLRFYGNPFMISIIDEPFSQLKQKILASLDNELDSNIIIETKSPVIEIDDNTSIFAQVTPLTQIILICKEPKQCSQLTSHCFKFSKPKEKSIVIYN